MISVIETEAAAVKAKLEAEIERAREESAKAQHSAYVNQSTEARAVLEGQYETANHTYEELKISRPVIPELLPHISPLGWAHILLTGEYRRQKRR